MKKVYVQVIDRPSENTVSLNFVDDNNKRIEPEDLIMNPSIFEMVDFHLFRVDLFRVDYSIVVVYVVDDNKYYEINFFIDSFGECDIDMSCIEEVFPKEQPTIVWETFKENGKENVNFNGVQEFYEGKELK